MGFWRRATRGWHGLVRFSQPPCGAAFPTPLLRRALAGERLSWRTRKGSDDRRSGGAKPFFFTSLPEERSVGRPRPNWSRAMKSALHGRPNLPSCPIPGGVFPNRKHPAGPCFSTSAAEICRPRNSPKYWGAGAMTAYVNAASCWARRMGIRKRNAMRPISCWLLARPPGLTFWPAPCLPNNYIAQRP